MRQNTETCFKALGIVALRDRFRCIAPDYLGFGLSERPDGFGYKVDEHAGVVADFVATIRSGEWDAHDGAPAAELARVVDACYRSAAEQREVSLSALPSP